MLKILIYGQALVACFFAFMAVSPAIAHEGHDHDEPPPLNLPVAPRVIAVTPELELVGVISGENQLTIFLHAFATNEPVKGAKMTVSIDDDELEAKPDGDGVFTLTAPWIGKGASADLIFSLTFADGNEDLLTGRLEVPQSLETARAGPVATVSWYSQFADDPRYVMMIPGSFVIGVLLTLLFLGGRSRSQANKAERDDNLVANVGGKAKKSLSNVPRIIQSVGTCLATVGLISIVASDLAHAEGNAELDLPSIPSTMATDQPQRMPDATLFIPKATQHLLSIRTQIAVPTKAAKTIELSGRVIAGPQNLGRIQSSRPGRFESADNKVAFVGMRVKAGDILGYVETYIEAADKANISSQIAETEARIAKNERILKRYLQLKGTISQIKIEETRGELQALVKRREELLPSKTAREPLIAPINGVISSSNVVVGQVVESRDVLFEIINPSEFWIEAITADPGVIKNLNSAVGMVHHHTEPMDLKYMGRGLALRHHSNVLNFKVLSQTDHLSVGSTARIILRSNETSEGVVLPASSVVRGNTGLPIVWIKTKAERFRPQPVKIEPFDGTSVIVTAGVKTDERVVTRGVTLLNQVR